MKTVLLAAFAALSQPGESPRRTEVADLSWREGCWEGEGFGGAISECWLAAFAAQAQPEEARVRADIADLAWLEGCWEGEGFGGAISECWMRGPTGRLTGTFQLLEPDGTQRFSEILLLDVFEDGPAMRVKHFTPDFVGWEDKDAYLTFVLEETRDGYGRFRGLTLELTEDGRQIATLMMRDAEGNPREERLVYERLASGQTGTAQPE